MNAATEQPVNARLVHDLRCMARTGASLQVMADKVCESQGIPANSFVPVFAYLRQAFWVPLKTLLPLQEGFDGLYAQVAQVAVHFSAEVLHRLDDVMAWTWERFRERMPQFDASDLQFQVNEPDNCQIAFCLSKAVPKALYFRGFVQAVVDKSKAWDRVGEREKRIHDFVAQFVSAIRQVCESQSLSRISPTALNLDFQVEDIGPRYRIVCLVQILEDVSVEKPVLASA